jgi:predicted metal-dependent peptidase
LQPRVDWREALQRFIRSRAKTDYSWSRPNRRFSPLYLPSMDSPTCGPLVVVIDVSGSVSQSVLDQFIAEVRDIAETLRPEEVIVMCADTHVRSIERFRPGDEITVKPTGGGGTAFDDPFRKVEEEDIRPEALVYLTDLIGSCFAPEPHYPVLWASTARERAPYGEVIRVR